jgi:hypothetical protein
MTRFSLRVLRRGRIFVISILIFLCINFSKWMMMFVVTPTLRFIPFLNPSAAFSTAAIYLAVKALPIIGPQRSLSLAPPISVSHSKTRPASHAHRLGQPTNGGADHSAESRIKGTASGHQDQGQETDTGDRQICYRLIESSAHWRDNRDRVERWLSGGQLQLGNRTDVKSGGLQLTLLDSSTASEGRGQQWIAAKTEEEGDLLHWPPCWGRRK